MWPYQYKPIIADGRAFCDTANMFHKMSELEYIGMVRENIIVGDESHRNNRGSKETIMVVYRLSD